VNCHDRCVTARDATHILRRVGR